MLSLISVMGFFGALVVRTVSPMNVRLGHAIFTPFCHSFGFSLRSQQCGIATLPAILSSFAPTLRHTLFHFSCATFSKPLADS